MYNMQLQLTLLIFFFLDFFIIISKHLLDLTNIFFIKNKHISKHKHKLVL